MLAVSCAKLHSVIKIYSTLVFEAVMTVLTAEAIVWAWLGATSLAELSISHKFQRVGPAWAAN